MIHPALDPCEVCGGEYVEANADGLMVSYLSAAYGTFVAKLVEGDEP